MEPGSGRRKGGGSPSPAHPAPATGLLCAELGAGQDQAGPMLTLSSLSQPTLEMLLSRKGVSAVRLSAWRGRCAGAASPTRALMARKNERAAWHSLDPSVAIRHWTSECLSPKTTGEGLSRVLSNMAPGATSSWLCLQYTASFQTCATPRSPSSTRVALPCAHLGCRPPRWGSVMTGDTQPVTPDPLGSESTACSPRKELES